MRQEQIAEIFGKNRTVITKHINNIFKEEEVDEKSNVQKMHIANSDKPVKFYALYKSNGELKINDNALASLALLVAMSKPEQKDIIIKLIMNILYEEEQ